jgi:Flp pilus assembly protein TadG
MRPIPSRQRGAVAIMVALSIVMLLALVGLIIDGGLAYLVKARLNAAVDSAALAAARAVPEGNTQTEQIASAKAAAADFFAANISSDYMSSKPAITNTSVVLNGGMATIDIQAEAPMTVSVMQLLGFSSLTPVASAQTIRRDLDMAFVVDTSGSLTKSAANVQASAKSFLNKFNVTQDRVALIHFASGVEVDNPINQVARGFDRNSMLNNIAAFDFDGGTSSVEGMWNARDQLNKIALANRSSMRVIVFFSDGAPTSFGTYLNFNSSSDCPIAGALDSNRAYPGLYDLKVSEDMPASTVYTKCKMSNPTSSAAKSLTAYYNWHTTTFANRDAVSEFPIVTPSNAFRVVTNELSTGTPSTNVDRNIDRAARNLAEAMAAKARDEGIYVFTLGMGASLKNTATYDNETNESVLKCMANVADGPSRCYDANKPVGMYCYAATDADLTPCFSRLASAILRISK